MKKAKTKVKKKMTPSKYYGLARDRAARARSKPEPGAGGGPAGQTYLYHIEEFQTTGSTEDMQAKFDDLGLQGWQLVWIGAHGSAPDTVRVFFIQPGV